MTNKDKGIYLEDHLQSIQDVKKVLILAITTIHKVFFSFLWFIYVIHKNWTSIKRDYYPKIILDIKKLFNLLAYSLIDFIIICHIIHFINYFIIILSNMSN